ncbi:L-arabinose transport system permease protein AraQ [subsurface metagenome]|nr:ABC transporter permease subunit [Clostridia bacterium]
MNKEKDNKGKLKRTNPIVYVLLALGGIIMIFPFVWMVATSFKQPWDVFNLSIIPPEVTFSNYIRLFEKSDFPRWFLNSFVVGLLVTFSVLFFDSLVGYTLCKFNFRGKKIIFILILSTMMIPTEMLVIPWYIMSNKWGWVNSYWGIMFPGIMTGFGTFLMRQFFQGVPDELLDAARIDGLNEFQIWWKIAMPLVKPAISALAIFTFLGNWNAFLWPLIVISKTELYTLPVGLAFFSGEFQTEWEMVMTGASVATIPVLIVFLIFQKQIIKGIALSGLKG